MNLFEAGSRVSPEKINAVSPVSAGAVPSHSAHAEAVVLALPSRVPLADAIAATLGLPSDIFVVQTADVRIQKDSNLWGMLRQLEDQHPELRVLEMHKRTRIGQWLQSSVIETLFQRNRWPVLVLGPHAFERSAPGAGFRKILYATDMSTESVHALLYASAVARQHDGKMFVLQADAYEEGDLFEQQVAQQVLRNWLQSQSVEHAEPVLAEAGCIVRFGKPEQKILEIAAELHTDMIVLGAHGRGEVPLHAHFVGGTAYEVASSAYAPVLIVPGCSH